VLFENKTGRSYLVNLLRKRHKVNYSKKENMMGSIIRYLVSVNLSYNTGALTSTLEHFKQLCIINPSLFQDGIS
jgi:hypothetical protein